MAPRDLLTLVARRWYVTAAGVLMTAGVVLTQQHQPPTYWGRVTVVVLPPTAVSPNVLTQQGPVAVAALAVMDVTGKPLDLRASSSDATLYGLGVTSGTWIRLRNTGSQWRPSASNPYVDVDAVARTPAEVDTRISAAVDALRRAVETRQEDLRTAPRYRATTDEVPGAPVVQQIPPSTTRALGTTVLSGAGWTAAALILAESMARSRRRRTGGRERVLRRGDATASEHLGVQHRSDLASGGTA